MTKKNHPRKRRGRVRIDDSIKVQLAIERFKGGIVEVRELARRHQRSPGVVSRAISSAFAEGLVEVRRVEREQIQRMTELELAVRRRFPLLRAAIVVDVVEEKQDLLHERLGQALAEYMFNRVWSDGERFLVGAGRCVYHMAERLGRLGQGLRPMDATLIAVCGDSYPYHDVNRNVCLDADANVNCLAQAFDQPVRMGLTSRHVFISGAGDKDWREQYYGQFWSEPPTLAALGIGVLDAQHQLVLLTDPVKSRQYPPANIPMELASKVQRLFALLEQHRIGGGPGNRHAVAEIGMWLFVIPPVLAAAEVPVRVCEEIDELLAEVNAELFSPGPARLALVRSLVLVGGGEKAAAFKYLLDGPAAGGPPYAAHMICIDKSCARRLLKS